MATIAIDDRNSSEPHLRRSCDKLQTLVPDNVLKVMLDEFIKTEVVRGKNYVAIICHFMYVLLSECQIKFQS